MNIFAKNKSNLISERKQHHIDVCRAGAKFEIEGTLNSGFEAIRFIHCALPELNYETLNTSWSFLGYQLPFPLFISCMTGGSPEGCVANRELAQAAQRCRLPLGLGSMRVILDSSDRISDFQMREVAKDVPIMANIGGVQVRDYGPRRIIELTKQIEANAIVVHLNCGQELFQSGGDRNFSGVHQAILELVNLVGECQDLAVIVKETGFGISPSLVRSLLNAGVSYVDIAGAGGTNWVMVEEACAARKGGDSVVSEFEDWGLPTAVILGALGSGSFVGASSVFGSGLSSKRENLNNIKNPKDMNILASGGIRSGMDLAKAVALGAKAGGMALPLIRAALDGGADQVCREVEQIRQTFLNVMLLTGAGSIEELQKKPLLFHSEFQNQVNQLKMIEGL